MEPIIAFFLGVGIVGLVIGIVNLINGYRKLKRQVETHKWEIEELKQWFKTHLESTSRRFGNIETQIENTKKVQKILNDSKKGKKSLKG